MSSIFTRSALEYLSGGHVAPDVHHVIIDHHGKHVVTYAEHMEGKRARQAMILQRKRATELWQAWRLSVWWSPGLCGWIFRGYHAWLDRYDGAHEWIRYRSNDLMRLFPVRLPLGDERDRWEEWLQAFVKAHPAGRKCGKPRGAAVVWCRGNEMRRGSSADRGLQRPKRR